VWRNAVGDGFSGVAPSLDSFSLTVGMAITLVSAAFNVSITCFGVPLGAASPIQSPASSPGNPSSLKVGTSGTAAERVLPVCARMRICPLCMKGSVPPRLLHITGMCPAMRSFTAGALPL